MKGASKKRSDRAFRAIEAMLRHMHPREDNDARMDALRAHFGSPAAMLNSNSFVLQRAGLHPSDALLFSKLHELVRYSKRNSYAKRVQLGRLPLAAQFLVDNSHGLKVERFYMLCLDAKGRLMERVFLQEGTLDGMLFNLRGLLAEVVRVSPCAIVLSHNHPGCTLRPSNEDINCTCAAIRALTAVGIPLLDHIIVAGKQAVSMRENGFIPAVQWLQQAPENQLLRCWLDGQASSKK